MIVENIRGDLQHKPEELMLMLKEINDKNGYHTYLPEVRKFMKWALKTPVVYDWILNHDFIKNTIKQYDITHSICSNEFKFVGALYSLPIGKIFDLYDKKNIKDINRMIKIINCENEDD
jgi:hypothetical protein